MLKGMIICLSSVYLISNSVVYAQTGPQHDNTLDITIDTDHLEKRFYLAMMELMEDVKRSGSVNARDMEIILGCVERYRTDAVFLAKSSALISYFYLSFHNLRDRDTNIQKALQKLFLSYLIEDIARHRQEISDPQSLLKGLKKLKASKSLDFVPVSRSTNVYSLLVISADFQGSLPAADSFLLKIPVKTRERPDGSFLMISEGKEISFRSQTWFKLMMARLGLKVTEETTGGRTRFFISPIPDTLIGHGDVNIKVERKSKPMSEHLSASILRALSDITCSFRSKLVKDRLYDDLHVEELPGNSVRIKSR
jgi:hypothetical protein